MSIAQDVIKQYYCKAKNRRIWIELYYFKDENDYLFRICTKTYQGGRNIFKTDNWYSVQTFLLIRDLIKDFYDIHVDMVVSKGKVNADVDVFNKVIEHYNEHVKQLE